MQFISSYLDLHKDQEVSRLAQRWAAIAVLGAAAGSRFWLPEGVQKLYPNNYIILCGEPGSKPEQVLRPATSLLFRAGYYHFAADRNNPSGLVDEFSRNAAAQKEIQLVGAVDPESPEYLLLNIKQTPAPFNLEQSAIESLSAPSQDIASMAAAATFEYGLFTEDLSQAVGLPSEETFSFLASLWDSQQFRTYSKGKPVVIRNPIITLLAAEIPGSSITSYSAAGTNQGMLGRCILANYGMPAKRQVLLPELDYKLTKTLINQLSQLRAHKGAELAVSREAYQLLREINLEGYGVPDNPRFLSYNSFRYQHLKKLTIAFWLSDTLADDLSLMNTSITSAQVLAANTLLAYTETKMAICLMEPASKNSTMYDSHIMRAISKSTKPYLTVNELFNYVTLVADIKDVGELEVSLSRLLSNNRIMQFRNNNNVPQGYGKFPRKLSIKEHKWIDSTFFKQLQNEES